MNTPTQTIIKADATHRIVCIPNGRYHFLYRVEFANGVSNKWTNMPAALKQFRAYA